MNKLQLIKIALLTALLVEEVRNAMGKLNTITILLMANGKEKERLKIFLIKYILIYKIPLMFS